MMDYYISVSLELLFSTINSIANLVTDIVGEYGIFVVLGTVLTFVVYRLIIKPLTGYGVSSDSARPKKDEKGE